MTWSNRVGIETCIFNINKLYKYGYKTITAIINTINNRTYNHDYSLSIIKKFFQKGRTTFYSRKIKYTQYMPRKNTIESIKAKFPATMVPTNNREATENLIRFD